ncbi:MAG: energy transducer TonB [Candidatus Sulfotelmatobacter sp.]
MFAQLNFAIGRRERWLRIGSLVFHALLLVWLLHSREPQLISVSSVASGENGKSVTRLYWPSKSPDDSTQSSSDNATQRYRHQRFSHNKLAFNPSPQTAQSVAPKNPLAHTNTEDDSKTQTLSALGHGAQAGATYGSLYRGPLFGDEVRPALPIATSDPVVYPWQLPDYGGNEVIEITIDERGEIVRKTVLHSLGPDIDDKCLAALENWHFHPATRNGAPIPSKQDAIFPFRARG